MYLCDGDDYIQVHVVKWDRFRYETDEEYQLRIENLPLLPLGLAVPLRKEYDIENKILPFKVKAFQYTERLLEMVLDGKVLDYTCDRELAQKLCTSSRKVILFGRADVPLRLYAYDLWEIRFGKFYHYDEENIPNIKRKIQENYRLEADQYYEQAKNSNSVEERLECLRKAANLGDKEAQYCLGELYIGNKYQLWRHIHFEEPNKIDLDIKLGDCFEEGKGIEQNHQKALDCYRKVEEYNQHDGFTTYNKETDNGTKELPSVYSILGKEKPTILNLIELHVFFTAQVLVSIMRVMCSLNFVRKTKSHEKFVCKLKTRTCFMKRHNLQIYENFSYI